MSLPVEQVAGDIKTTISERGDGGHLVEVPPGIYRITASVVVFARGGTADGVVQIRTNDVFDLTDPGNTSRLEVVATNSEFRPATTMTVTRIFESRSPISVEMISLGDGNLISIDGWMLIERLG